MKALDSKILIVDSNRSYFNILRYHFPNLNFVFYNIRSKEPKIDLDGIEIVFLNCDEINLNVFTECFNKAKWIFMIVMSRDTFTVDYSNYFFLIDSGWTKLELMGYVSQSFRKIELENFKKF